jgi:sphingomyelin phosphodiesterase
MESRVLTGKTDTIIQRFDATIAAVFYGYVGYTNIAAYMFLPANYDSRHTHKDEFEIAYSNYTNQDASTATMMSYIAGALTPTSGNPTFRYDTSLISTLSLVLIGIRHPRVYDVDPVTFGVLDMHVYYANISSPTYQTGPTWELLYSAKDLYGTALGVTDAAAELTPAFWHDLTALFETDDNIFQTYYAYKNRDYEPSTCDSDCKTAEICQLRAAQSQYNW